MNYKLTLMGLLLISTTIPALLPSAKARDEHGGGGPAASPQQQRSAPAPQQRSAPAPQQQQRSFAPQQQRSFAPQQQRSFAPQQQRSFAPQQQRSFAPQQQRSFAPQQRSFAPQQQRSFAPQQQRSHVPQAEKSFSQAAHENTISHDNRNHGSSPSAETAKGRNLSENNRLQDTTSRNNKAVNERSMQPKLGEAKNEDWGSQISRQVGSLGAMAGVAAIFGGGAERGSIEKPSSFANPRHVAPPSPGMSPRFSANRPDRLSYRSGASNIPRAGRVGEGRAGVVDPGGYVRTPRNGSARIDRNSMQQQLSSLPNYSRNFNNNNRLRNSNHSQWTGGWNPGPNAGNLGYYSGYSWNGNNYPYNYYGLIGYSPTPWLFMLESGAFWQPGFGYAESLPYGYTQPISIAVVEVVPSYDIYGNIMGYRDETFYYNAVWDPNSQAYGYYDYHGAFHWITFPWLKTWIG